ncbi:hypothetical protein HDU87_002982 [Geranomyces variabilis]|uniref:Uncharacterized protein n=1 Tax=Geranomyces variabilis TaxID=109894 RepID=A0AAD5TKS4_9FUNG|nr:hypothetical protein HDU87_002982 [Geranomyces variabilis]
MGLISATNNGSYGAYSHSNNGNNVRVQNNAGGGGGGNSSKYYSGGNSSNSAAAHPGFATGGGVYGGGSNYQLAPSNSISNNNNNNNNNNNGQSSSSFSQSATTSSTNNPTEICRIQNAPHLIESLRQRHETHVTPHIQRDRDETIVQQIVQPIKDQVTAPAVHHHQQAQQINREIADALLGDDARRYKEQRQIATTGGKSVERIDNGVFQNDPVVKERVNVHVIEEIQPVIWRTIDETHVYHTAQPIYEHHTGAPKVQDIRYNPPISMEEFEKRGGSMTGTGLYQETRRSGY